MEWLTFDLHPEYPPEGIPREQLLRRYGDHFTNAVRTMIEESGLPMHPEIEIVPNARNSLVLAELARDSGVLAGYRDKVFAAYWADARDIGDEEVILELATEAGIDEAAARAELTEKQRLDRVLGSTAEATGAGVTGVPAWVIDQRVLVPGAQPHEVFDRVLQRMGHEPIDGAGANG